MNTNFASIKLTVELRQLFVRVSQAIGAVSNKSGLKALARIINTATGIRLDLRWSDRNLTEYIQAFLGRIGNLLNQERLVQEQSDVGVQKEVVETENLDPTANNNLATNKVSNINSGNNKSAKRLAAIINSDKYLTNSINDDYKRDINRLHHPLRRCMAYCRSFLAYHLIPIIRNRS